MAVLLLQPRHLAWYRDLIALFLKYGRTDLVARARLEEVLSEDLPPADKDGATPESFVADLERLGPTFVKLGQLLSTRPDLLPEPYLLALSRLQDDVPPKPPGCSGADAAPLENRMVYFAGRISPRTFVSVTIAW